MPGSYNLRSLQRKESISVRHCYLQNLLENKSPEVFNPKVRLERLKLLDCHGIQRSRFYLENGRITMKQNKSFLLSKRFLLKILCTVILLAAFSLYWRDYLQSYGIILTKKCAEIHPVIQNYYSNGLRFHHRILKQFNYKWAKLNSENGKSISFIPKEELTEMHGDLQIEKLVRHYYEDVKRKNKIGNTEKPNKSFIEDQCRSTIQDKFSSVKNNNLYNVTLSELANFTDYALESQGAKIVSVFNTELYGTITVKYFNFNLWPKISQFLMKYLKCFSSNGPNSVLIPWKKPGDCWAFKGSHGRIQIELSQRVIITAITIDHIPKEVAPYGSFQSAPKKFSLMGIEKCKSQICKTYLGSYEYKSAGPATQTFFIRPIVEIPFERVEVVIQSNQGNDKYTCIYKIRIHGY